MPDVIVKNEPALPKQLTDPNVVTLLRPDQVREFEDDIRFCEESLKNPAVQDKGAVIRRKRALEDAYNRQMPVKVTGKLRENLAKLETTLREKITQGMPTQEEMRKNPAGTVDKHMRWERSNKADIMQWKKIRRMLAADDSHPSTWDTESSNLEKYRPHGAVGYGYRGDAGIPGHMAYQDIPEEKWPFDPPQNTALEQVKQRAKKERTPEEQAKLNERMQKARNARYAKYNPSQEVAPSVVEESKSEPGMEV